MSFDVLTDATQVLRDLPPDRPVLICGPTASGKSDLALAIAAAQGGVIVNADASQVYDCWRVLTARPSGEEEAAVPHRLYGHVGPLQTYSTGHWLREVSELISEGPRPIIVGGTGLYFTALTRGLADIPATPDAVRHAADAMDLTKMLEALDAATHARIDIANRARVQRAWEVMTATGRGLADWQDDTGPPILPEANARLLCFDMPRETLTDRIALRFDKMIDAGALDEVRAVMPDYDTRLPAHRAIGVPELVAHLRNEITLRQAREAAVISTRQFAKRQRTWFRSRMASWQRYAPCAKH